MIIIQSLPSFKPRMHNYPTNKHQLPSITRVIIKFLISFITRVHNYPTSTIVHNLNQQYLIVPNVHNYPTRYTQLKPAIPFRTHST